MKFGCFNYKSDSYFTVIRKGKEGGKHTCRVPTCPWREGQACSSRTVSRRAGHPAGLKAPDWTLFPVSSEVAPDAPKTKANPSHMLPNPLSNVSLGSSGKGDACPPQVLGHGYAPSEHLWRQCLLPGIKSENMPSTSYIEGTTTVLLKRVKFFSLSMVLDLEETGKPGPKLLTIVNLARDFFFFFSLLVLEFSQ